jgi:hypothetical protein
VRQQPFRPFVIGLVDGRKLEVTHPEFVAVSQRHLLYIHPQTEQVTWIEPGLVLTLDFKDGAPPLPVEQGPSGS